MRELRSELGFSHSSITRACLTLQRKGLVRITPAPSDRRRKTVELTVRGDQVIGEVIAALHGLRR